MTTDHTTLRIVDDVATASICISDGSAYLARACYLFSTDVEARREAYTGIERLVTAYNERPGLRAALAEERARLADQAASHEEAISRQAAVTERIAADNTALRAEVERLTRERDRLANGLDEVVVRIESIATQFGHPGVLPVDRLRAIEIGIAGLRAALEIEEPAEKPGPRPQGAAMTTADLESATSLAARIERDGEWHTSGSMIRDHRREAAVASYVGRSDAADIVEARRLVPVLLADVKRLEEQLRDARAYGDELWERLRRTYPEAAPASTGERCEAARYG